MKTWLRAIAAALALLAPIEAIAQTVATPTAVESGRVICSTAPCQVYGGQVNNTNAASRWVMIFDAAAVPADGSVTGCLNASATRPCVLKWYQIGANSTIGISEFFINQPLPLKVGLSIACSTTGPFTKTATADCTFSFEVQQ